MQNIRFARFPRLTALGVAVSLFGLSLSPLAHAQAAAEPKPDAAKPAAPAAPKPGDARPADTTKPAKPAEPKPGGAAKPAKPVDVKSAAKPADAAKPPNKKTRDAARKSYADGEKAFASGDYAGAYAGFESAYALIPSPHAEYWMAKSLEGQGRTEEAIAAYEKYLANPEAARVGDDKVADARTRIDELKLKLVAQIDILTVPPNANVLVDGNPEPGTTPMTLKLAPGAHKITISANGYETKEIDVQAAGGEKTEQKIALVAKPPPAPPPPPPEPVVETPPAPPPPPPEKRSMVPAFVTLGIAAAGAAVGTVFGLQALSAKSDFDDNPTTKAADDTERNALIADMAFGVAITLGVTGIVLLTSGDEAPRENTAAKLRKLPPRTKLELDGYASKTGGGASARLSF